MPKCQLLELLDMGYKIIMFVRFKEIKAKFENICEE